mmetsp:Transcript_16280/g.33011  ORF Transcript_16280/g.33011 Transcript_16280/m.33011 type:complete len:206 (-) Transcript_16280:1352-1969(-)
MPPPAHHRLSPGSRQVRHHTGSRHGAAAGGGIGGDGHCSQGNVEGCADGDGTGVVRSGGGGNCRVQLLFRCRNNLGRPQRCEGLQVGAGQAQSVPSWSCLPPSTAEGRRRVRTQICVRRRRGQDGSGQRSLKRERREAKREGDRTTERMLWGDRVEKFFFLESQLPKREREKTREVESQRSRSDDKLFCSDPVCHSRRRKKRLTD